MLKPRVDSFLAACCVKVRGGKVWVIDDATSAPKHEIQKKWFFEDFAPVSSSSQNLNIRLLSNSVEVIMVVCLNSTWVWEVYAMVSF